MKMIWFAEAWDDYVYWQTHDKKTLKRINLLLQDIMRNSYSGIGKPEPLKGEFSGFWSGGLMEAIALCIASMMVLLKSCPARGIMMIEVV
ncbi:MAG: Txe/YoeB family addiction module toxin [Thermoguttaceae bacterium]